MPRRGTRSQTPPGSTPWFKGRTWRDLTSGYVRHSYWKSSLKVRGFSHEKWWWFSIVMLVYQRVSCFFFRKPQHVMGKSMVSGWDFSLKPIQRDKCPSFPLVCNMARQEWLWPLKHQWVMVHGYRRENHHLQWTCHMNKYVNHRYTAKSEHLLSNASCLHHCHRKQTPSNQ